MTYEDVLAFIEGGKYINTKPFSTHREDPDKRQAYQLEEARLIQLFKDDCKQLVVTKVGADSTEGFEKLYRFAWEEGHADGLHEVLYWLDEVATIVTAYREAK